MPRSYRRKLKGPRNPSLFNHDRLNILKNSLLELALDLLARVVGARLAVQTEESTKVELGCLEELDLADVDLRVC
jgi:hypothetical protein